MKPKLKAGRIDKLDVVGGGVKPLSTTLFKATLNSVFTIARWSIDHLMMKKGVPLPNVDLK